MAQVDWLVYQLLRDGKGPENSTHKVIHNLRGASGHYWDDDNLDFYYQGRYTIVEMEAGPYLDACYEIAQPGRYPIGESVNMARLSFDLGIVHYASDTPYTQVRTLGARGLSYRGMDLALVRPEELR